MDVSQEELEKRVAEHKPVLTPEKMAAIEGLIGPGFIVLYRKPVVGEETEETLKGNPSEMGFNHITAPVFALLAGAVLSRIEESLGKKAFNEIILHSKYIKGAEKKPA